MVYRVVAEILGVVIVKLGGGDDADAGQRLSAEHGAGVFAAVDKAFGDDFAVQVAFAQLAVHFRQLAGLLHFHHAHAAAFGGRLHKHRQAELGFHGGKIGIIVQYGEIGYGQAECLPNQFAAVFIHTQRGGGHAAAGVGDADGIEQRLHGAVFAIGAVQHIEGYLKTLRFQLQDVLFFRVEPVGIDAPALQGGQYGRAAVERHFALAGKSAVQYGHFAKLLVHLLCFFLTSTFR